MNEDMPKENLILHNANVLTMDADQPRARMIVVQDGKIVAVSKIDDLRSFRGGSTEIIDCRGSTVLPGFHDAHCHPIGFAESLMCPDLSSPVVRSIADIQLGIVEAATTIPDGNWVRARGYNEFYLVEQRQPDRRDLDKATTTHPVKLTHSSGHVHVLNSLGLKLTSISSDTPDPPGGVIERDMETGEPNGILYEMGSYLAERIPSLSDAEMERGIRLVSDRFVSQGITSVQDASVRNGIQRWRNFQQWKRSGSFIPRVTMMIGSEAFESFQQQGFTPGIGDDQLQLGAVKIILHRATGWITPSQEELNDKVLALHRLGFQVAMHAVEEETIEAAYKALKNALQIAAHPDHRHRIEHCSVCRPVMAEQLSRLGAVIVTQPGFIYYNGERYLKTVPLEQIEQLYPMGTFVKAKLKMAAGSDCPVVPSNPLSGIYAAVSRMTKDGHHIAPEQIIDIEAALHSYTEGAAYSCFEENNKGSVIPGELADLVVLNDDPTEVSIEEIPEIEVEMTVLGGKVVWRKGI
jgi:predicted amidohydrolase YtcJ